MCEHIVHIIDCMYVCVLLLIKYFVIDLVVGFVFCSVQVSLQDIERQRAIVVVVVVLVVSID